MVIFFLILRYSCHMLLEKVSIFGSPVFLDPALVVLGFSSLRTSFFIFPSQHEDIQSTFLSPLFQIHSLKEGDMTHFWKRTIHFWCEGQGLHTKEFGCLWSLCHGVASLMPEEASLDSRGQDCQVTKYFHLHLTPIPSMGSFFTSIGYFYVK